MIELPKSEARKNRRAQFSWIMKNPDIIDSKDYMFKALELGSKLVGILFSHDEMIAQILNKFQTSSDYENYLIEKNTDYMRAISSEIEDSIYLHEPKWNQVKNIEYKEITDLKEIEVKPGVITLLKAPMGSGKTKDVGAPECKKHDYSTLAVCHRVTLVKQLSTRLGLTYYRDKKFNQQSQPSESGIRSTNNEKSDKGLATCINSIFKANSLLNSQPTLFLIDEISQVIDSILTSTKMYERAKIYNTFKEYIENTDFVLGMDAGLSNKDIEAIKLLTNKKIIIYRMPEYDNCMKINILSVDEHIKSLILEIARHGDKPFVLCSDSKAYIDNARKYFEENGLNGLTITADNKKPEIMGDLDGYIKKEEGKGKEEKIKFLLYSPAISSGVSIETKYFKHIYCVYHLIIQPTDLLQMIKRVRTVENVTMTIIKTSGDSLRDTGAEKKGYQEISQASNSQMNADDLLIQKLECERLNSIQMKYAPLALHKSMLDKKWEVTFNNNPDQNTDTLSEVAKKISQFNSESKQEFIKKVKEAKILEHQEQTSLCKQEFHSEQERYNLIKTSMYFTSKVRDLKKEDILLLKNQNHSVRSLIHILNNTPSEDWAKEKGKKHQLGSKEFPIETINYLKTKNKLYKELFKIAGIDLWKGPTVVNTGELVNALVKRRNSCLAFGIMPRIPKTSKVTSKDEDKMKLARSFFREIGLKINITGELDIERLRQVQTYANNWREKDDLKKRPLITNPNEKKRPATSKRGRQLEILLEKNQFVMLNLKWVFDKLESLETENSAKKWVNKINKNDYQDYFKYEIRSKYKNGRVTSKTFLTTFNTKEKLIEVLKKDNNFKFST